MASLSDDEDEDGGAAAQALIAKKNAEREAAKRATKGGPQAKSSLILDVKPEDSETDMDELVKEVKGIEMEGLTWGPYRTARSASSHAGNLVTSYSLFSSLCAARCVRALLLFRWP